MHIVIYLFKVKPNRKEDFIKSWIGLTELIYKYEGSLGSRLHKENESQYIAYAQWPDINTIENSGNNLPEQANYYRDLMRDSCDKIEVLHKVDVVHDLLKKNQND